MGVVQVFALTLQGLTAVTVQMASSLRREYPDVLVRFKTQIDHHLKLLGPISLTSISAVIAVSLTKKKPSLKQCMQ